MDKNKFVEMLGKKQSPDKNLIQKIIPGIKFRDECGNTCLILRNCKNVNNKLIKLFFVYAQVISKISSFLKFGLCLTETDTRYIEGYNKAYNDIKACIDEMKIELEENETFDDITFILNESYECLREIKQHNIDYLMTKKANDILVKYDKFFGANYSINTKSHRTQRRRP